MTLEDRGDVSVVTHALARHELTDLRDVGTDQVDFREGLERLGRLCGETLLDARFDLEPERIETPLTETDGERLRGREDVVVVTVLRAAIPFVDGLTAAFPRARQGVISASRDEAAGMDDEGRFRIEVNYVNVPDIRPDDTVIVADPMLATGSTMVAVLDELTAHGAAPSALTVLAAVAAPAGVERVVEARPEADVVTVAVDEHLDEEGFIVPGLGDAGDRAFRTR
jgi:uracil phosphoribosyltransferase